MAHEQHHKAEEQEHADHVVSPRIYIGVLSALMFLLIVTVAAACVDFDRKIGPYWSMSIALLIAITKAVLIILFFMHVKYGTKVTWAFAASAFVWLGIMMTLTLSDYFTQDPRETPRVMESPAEPMGHPRPQPESAVGGISPATPPVRVSLGDSR